MDCPVSVKEFTYQLFLIFTIITYIYSRRMAKNLASSGQGGNENPRKVFLNARGLPIRFSGIIIGMDLYELQTRAKNIRT
jgi:hypothetical protein